MIRINLLPVKEKERAAARRQELSLVLLVGLLSLVSMGGLWFRQTQQISKLDAGILELETSIAALNSQVGEVANLERKQKELDGKLKVIEDLSRKRVGPIGVMRDLSGATPDRLWLIEVNETGGAATITGRAVDNQTIADFLRRLSASPYFRTVDLVETAEDAAPGGVKLRKFIVRAQIDYAASRVPVSPNGSGPADAAVTPPEAEAAR